MTKRRYGPDWRREMIWIGKGSSWLVIAAVIIVAAALAAALH